ncbi:hypothetical protein ACLB1Q_17630 [Escherichia coli]
MAKWCFDFATAYPNIQHNLRALEDVWDYSYQHVPDHHQYTD